jgi:hypothetical protein
MMAHACNPSTQETEAGGSSVEGQPGQHKETPSQKEKKKEMYLELPKLFSRILRKDKVNVDQNSQNK